MEGARSGDEGSWSIIYRELAPSLMAFARGRGATDPEDVVGEVFVQVARRIDVFEGDARNFRAWVFTICRGKLIDDLRRRGRRREEPARLDTIERFGPVADAEAEAVSSLVQDELISVLDRLTADQREVVLLRVLAGFTTPEVANVMGKTVGSVEALQRRAFAQLKKILG